MKLNGKKIILWTSFCAFMLSQTALPASAKEHEYFPCEEYNEFHSRYEHYDPYFKVFVPKKSVYKEYQPTYYEKTKALEEESTVEQSEKITPKPEPKVEQKATEVQPVKRSWSTTPTVQPTIQVTNQLRVAIIPMINATSEKHEYLDETANKEFDKLFTNPQYQRVSQAEVDAVLSEIGWNPEWLEMPEKEALESIAQKLKADYVLAFELADIRNWYGRGFMTSTAKSEVRIKCRAIIQGKYQVISGVNRGMRKISNFQLSFGGSNLGSAMVRGVRNSIDDCLIKIGLADQAFFDQLEEKDSNEKQKEVEKVWNERPESRK